MRSKRSAGILACIVLAVILGGGWLMLRPHGTARQATLGGFLLGAGVVAALNRLSEWHREARAAVANRARSLDETRRLLYATYFASNENAPSRDAWELGGTVANAVAHHWRSKSQADALALGKRVTEGHLGAGDFMELIVLISRELGDEAPERSTRLDLGPAPPGPPLA